VNSGFEVPISSGEFSKNQHFSLLCEPDLMNVFEMVTNTESLAVYCLRGDEIQNRGHVEKFWKSGFQIESKIGQASFGSHDATNYVRNLGSYPTQ